MKLDYLHLLQSDSVYFGRTQVLEDRLYEAYPSLFVPVPFLNGILSYQLLIIFIIRSPDHTWTKI